MILALDGDNLGHTARNEDGGGIERELCFDIDLESDASEANI